MRGVHGRRRTALAALVLLVVAAPVAAQDGSSTPPPTTAPTAPPPATKQAPAGAADAASAPTRTVTVDAGGGPPTLRDDLQAAIAAWTKAAPDIARLAIDPAASSSVSYAAPARLGPDTLSLDLRVPGRDGVEVHVASGAPAEHPMVLLHEVGVLLGLPEGGSGVMAFAVPASDEPTAPTAGDVQTLRAQRSYAREDLNRDGSVDFYDLVLFGQAYGAQGVNLPADFNGDGRVDRQDLSMLEKAYTFAPPSKTGPGENAPAPAPSPTAPATPPAGSGAPVLPTAPGSSDTPSGGASGGTQSTPTGAP